MGIGEMLVGDSMLLLCALVGVGDRGGEGFCPLSTLSGIEADTVGGPCKQGGDEALFFSIDLRRAGGEGGVGHVGS